MVPRTITSIPLMLAKLELLSKEPQETTDIPLKVTVSTYAQLLPLDSLQFYVTGTLERAIISIPLTLAKLVQLNLEQLETTDTLLNLFLDTLLLLPFLASSQSTVTGTLQRTITSIPLMLAKLVQLNKAPLETTVILLKAFWVTLTLESG